MTIGLLLAYGKAINRYSVVSRSICVVHLRGFESNSILAFGEEAGLTLRTVPRKHYGRV